MSVRTAAAPRHLRLPRPRGRTVLALALLAAALAGGWLWLRDSSLVRVQDVQITGARGFGAAAVRSALRGAALDMTTLNVDEQALRAAVARYPLVRDVSAEADPPHGLRIRVAERVPVGVLGAPGGRAVVADDGTLLRRVPAEGLPEIAVRAVPGGGVVGDRRTRAKVEVLAAAPAGLRRAVARVTLGRYGLTARLDSGLVLRFGDGSRLRAKWIAARRVMADPAAANARYLDLRLPERPAAGGLSAVEGGAPATGASPGAAPPTAAPATPAAPESVPAAPTG